MNSPRRFYHSIRFKLLLVSLTLLLIPWAGYRFIQETEQFLRQSQETMLLGTAQAVAAILHNQPALLGAERERDSDHGVYVNPLRHPVQLDGYLEEWRAERNNMRSYPTGASPSHFRALWAENERYLYLLLAVSDDQLLYQVPGRERLDQSDAVELWLEAGDDETLRYLITTSSPGWVNARQIPKTGAERALRNEPRIQGEWQESETGFTLELRIPRYLVGQRVGVRVIDRDGPSGDGAPRITSIPPQASPGALARLVRPNPRIEEIIGGLEHRNARIWVLNASGEVLARRGQLSQGEELESSEPSQTPGIFAFLLRLILTTPSERFEEPFDGLSRLNGPEISQAVSGQPATQRRPTPDGRAVILSAAWPIESVSGVAGAVLVEQSTNQILTLQNSVLERLFGITLVFFLLTGMALLGFASLLIRRVRRLRDRVEQAVTADGRIIGELPPERARDEIGDLGRSFSGVLRRLAEYNHYLEAMASRLAHEMRTPLSIVRTSLEIIQDDPLASDRQRYLERAKEGTERLTLILNRLREATRLEQLMRESESEPFDLNQLAANAIGNYRQVYPDVAFEYLSAGQPVEIRGVPDLISQALDKLISNAVDFHDVGSVIRCQLSIATPGQARLCVINHGPGLPTKMRRALFDSMVSQREKAQDEPHLGLGLYLVRLIAEFHGGGTDAQNLPDGSGVEFSLLLAAPGRPPG